MEFSNVFTIKVAAHHGIEVCGTVHQDLARGLHYCSLDLCIVLVMYAKAFG